MKKSLPALGKFLLWLALFVPISSGYSQEFASINNPEYSQKEETTKSLKEVLSDLSRMHQINFNYDSDLIKNEVVDLSSLDMSSNDLEQSIQQLFSNSSLRCEKVNAQYYVIYSRSAEKPMKKLKPKKQNEGKTEGILRNSSNLMTLGKYDSKIVFQDNIVQGRVTDYETEEGLPGVNIIIKGTSVGTTTDASGNYSIEVGGDQTLVFSYIGYIQEEVPVSNRSTVNVVLNQDIQSLQEVVVIGYGTQERKDLTGAISSVSSEELTKINASGLDEALQGRTAGVFVTPSAGQPGAPIEVNIRGVSSFGNNSPLYVIDGVPVFNEVSTFGAGQKNPLATLNPNDIESIDILKDASAAAIYGARAANGVVLITTKRGQSGEARLSFDGYAGVQQFNRTIDMLNSQQLAAYSIEAANAAGIEPPAAFSDPQVLQQNTDWQDEAFNAAPIQNYSLSITGGSEKSKYAVIGSYFDQEGILPNTAFTRYSVRVNTDFEIGSRLKIGESISLSRGEWLNGFNPTSDYLQELLQSSPTLPVRDPNNLGGFAGPTQEVTGRINRSNKIAELSLIDANTIQNRLLGSAYAELKIFEPLSYRLNVGADVLFGESKSFTPVYELGNRSNPRASINEGRRSENVFLLEHTLTFNPQINQDHDFTLLVGYSQQNSLVRNMSGGVQDFPNNETQTINAGFGQTNISGGETEWALRSILSRMNYSYKDKYLLMATVRRDGSSRFGSNQRYGTFPSFSTGWRLSEEPFMENLAFVSDMKVRFSWGQVGNQEIPPYAAYATIEPVARYILGTGQSVVPGAAFLAGGNRDLQWETTTQTNIGLDLGMFENRLFFVMDYFVKNTTDLLLQLPVPSSSGIRRNNGPFRNAGEIKNSGWEFSLTYRNSAGDFDYDISGNLSAITNEVVSLGGLDQIIAQLSSDPNFANTITRPGDVVGQFYGYVADGIFANQAEVDAHANQPGAAPGDVRFRDLNNDNDITPDDRQVIGNPLPDFFYGFSGNFNWKNFDMSLFFQGVAGNDIYNLLWAGINDGQGDNNATTMMLDRWTPNNTNTDVPRAIAGDPNDNDRPSTRFLEDGSYLRLRNLQVGYNFNEGLGNLNISNLRIYVSAQNLFTITDYRSYNPEVGILSTDSERRSLTRGIDFGTYPIPQIFTGGVQVTF
ncbi:MAG: SusC/RagA family TonB-linked outer membrane protein [Candidatus Cyclobacteriaceae bacterium M3_2C_046]